MIRRAYPDSRRRIILPSLIPAALIFFSGGAVSIYLIVVRDSTLAGALVGLSVLLLAGAFGGATMHRRLASARCPVCDGSDLIPQKSEDFRLLRICTRCQVEWDMGVCDDA